MAFSRKRIKTPEHGLLALHPFVDVLEGRSLFTATAHDSVLDIQQLVDRPTSDYAISAWSNSSITAASSDTVDDAGTALARRTTPHQFELKAETADAPFSTLAIDDTPWSLFGHGLHDRRGRFESREIPSDKAIAAARADASDNAEIFAANRSMTGAMAPFLTMKVSQQNHPFA